MESFVCACNKKQTDYVQLIKPWFYGIKYSGGVEDMNKLKNYNLKKN